jgi:hypothetical protein
MVEVDQSDWRVDSDVDLMTYGLGPCIGIVVGYYGRVSMLHAPMPDGGGAEGFFAELSDAIPIFERSTVIPILAGSVSAKGRAVPQSMKNTRAWVVKELLLMGFSAPDERWGCGGPLAGHKLTTSIQNGVLTIELAELLGEPETAIVKLW